MQINKSPPILFNFNVTYTAKTKYYENHYTNHIPYSYNKL